MFLCYGNDCSSIPEDLFVRELIPDW